MITFNCNAQLSCDEVMEYIKAEGFRSSSVSSYTMDSSWLYEVTAFTYEFKTYVIAKIKRNEYSYLTQSYIFCGIPDANWRNFRYGGYNDSDSYGERFNKYIMDYKCNCN